MMDVNNCFTYAYSAGTHADFEEACTTSAQLTNILDLIGAAAPTTIRIGEGKKAPYLKIKVTTAFAGAASGVEFKLFTHTAVDVSAGKEIWATGTLAVAQLALGTVIQIALPPGKYSRYLGIDYVAISEAATGGEIVAWLDENAEPDVTLFDMDDAV